MLYIGKITPQSDTSLLVFIISVIGLYSSFPLARLLCHTVTDSCQLSLAFLCPYRAKADAYSSNIILFKCSNHVSRGDNLSVHMGLLSLDHAVSNIPGKNCSPRQIHCNSNNQQLVLLNQCAKESQSNDSDRPQCSCTRCTARSVRHQSLFFVYSTAAVKTACKSLVFPIPLATIVEPPALPSI